MIEITSEDVARVEKILHDVPGGAERALSNAMNRGLSKVRTAAFKEVRGVYNVQNAALKAATSTRIRRASGNNMIGSILFSGVKIPLYKFKVTPQAIGTGETVKGSLEKGHMTEFAHAFIAEMDTGHIGVFERTGVQGIESRLQKLKDKGKAGNKHTEKVGEIMGLSAIQMIGNSDVIERVESEAQETISTRIDHEIDRILNGYGGGKK